MVSRTGVAAEVLSEETAHRRDADLLVPADLRTSEISRCSSEIRLLLRRNQPGIRFKRLDRAGRLRSTYRSGHPIDVDRRGVAARRAVLASGVTRFLDVGVGRLVGIFPIDGVGGPVGVVEISAVGRALLRRRLDVEEAITRLSNRLQRHAELGRQRRELDISLAWVAHELRGPLLAARLCLENTVGDLDPTAARPIARAADELMRLAAGLDSILHLAGGGDTIRRRRVDLASLVREAADCCVTETGDDRVVIEGRDRLAAVADPLHLRSAIENLIRNALRYSRPGTTVLVIVEPRGDHKVVEVQNRGSGIRSEDRERIFEPMAHGRRRAGTGVGLFVAQRVIERHGGSIRYHEPRDGLSAFELRLPARESA